jgi:hypothetical protein
MNKWKALAIIFTVLSLGSLKETFRILTSDAPDIAPNRTELIIMALTMTGAIIFFTIRFLKKASDKRLY